MDLMPFDYPDQPDLQAILKRIPEGWWGGLDIGPGWHAIVIKIDKELSKLDPDYQVLQVKEKFGTLRYYTQSSENYERTGDYKTEPFFKIIGEGESASAITCEECGGEGSLRTQRSWLRTLCDEDDTKVQAAYDKRWISSTIKGGD
jgi:hypothetical protein